MVEKPSAVTTRWVVRGALPIGLGIVALVAGWNIPMSGLVLIGGGLILGGLAIVAVARFMPTVTMAGAMIRAMRFSYVKPQPPGRSTWRPRRLAACGTPRR
jgi:hypothetical protein